MAIVLDKLPTILVLAVLVGIFVALGRHVKSERLRLWTAAWVLIFIHFCMGLFEPTDANPTPVVSIMFDGSLALAALFFIASLTSFFENKKLTLILLISAGLPVVGYTVALAYEWNQRAFYIACLATLLIGVPLGLAFSRKVTADAVF